MSARGMRYLDLSFEGRQRTKTAVSNNGFRPHGGHRGSRDHPPSIHSFNKPEEYHAELRQDMEQLHHTQTLEEEGSPVWLNQVTTEPSHSGESALFTHQLLAASRVEQKLELQFPLQLNKKPLHSKTPRAASASYYRPNSAHRYLSATEDADRGADQAEADSETHLGRPTRTTLLRARQRCNSAPVNAYQARRELQKRNEEKIELKKNLYNNVGSNMRDMMSTPSNDGGSMHSFLVGARYNRANCVDAKGVSDFGVYMARNNPLTCFLSSKHPSSAPTPREEKPAPHHPSSSPESLNSTGSSDRSASPSPPPSPTRRPQQAWMQVSSSRMPRQEPLEKPRRPTSGSRAREHVLNLNNELNVKGTSMSDKNCINESILKRILSEDRDGQAANMSPRKSNNGMKGSTVAKTLGIVIKGPVQRLRSDGPPQRTQPTGSLKGYPAFTSRGRQWQGQKHH